MVREETSRRTQIVHETLRPHSLSHEERMMKLDELIAWARSVLTEPWRGTGDIRVAQTIVNLLGVGFPCGFDEPGISADDGRIWLGGADADGDTVFETAEDALGFAAGLIRAAEP